MVKNKIEIINIKKNQKINKKIVNSLNIKHNDISSNNIDQNFNFSVTENSVLNIHCLLVNSNKQKSHIFTINQQKNSTVNIYVKAFGFNQSNTKVIIDSKIPKNAENIVLNQEINGYIFDDGSTIIATPSMLVDNNKIVANHSVSVGSINPEKLFYLMSKGIDTKTAKTVLIRSEYDYYKNFDDKKCKLIYKEVDKKIMELF